MNDESCVTVLWAVNMHCRVISPQPLHSFQPGEKMADVSQILEDIGKGDRQAAAQLLPAVYDDLRRLAAGKLAQEKPGQTLQATALVHEAFLRLMGSDKTKQWDHRGHFFMAAAEAMRRILVDNARRKKTGKRGGQLDHVDMDIDRIQGPEPDDELLALEEALQKLGVKYERKAKLVELRYFAGLTMEQAAATLNVSIATVERDWVFARAWLRREMNS